MPLSRAQQESSQEYWPHQDQKQHENGKASLDCRLGGGKASFEVEEEDGVVSELEISLDHKPNARAVEQLALEQSREELKAWATGQHEADDVVEDVDQDQADQEFGIRSETPEKIVFLDAHLSEIILSLLTPVTNLKIIPDFLEPVHEYSERYGIVERPQSLL